MKKIGIVGWLTSDNSFGITLPYAEFFSQFGQLEIITPTETSIRDLDLLVLPGGPDVSPNRYLSNSEPESMSFMNGKQCPFRERFDAVLLPAYIKNKIPIFGICRGHQSLAVFFGAQLKQHMTHETNEYNDRKKLVHEVITNDNKKFKVNSIHHQCVFECPIGATVSAAHAEDNTIEALSYIDYPIDSVQWHPEEIQDKFSIDLIKNLLYESERNP